MHLFENDVFSGINEIGEGRMRTDRWHKPVNASTATGAARLFLLALLAAASSSTWAQLPHPIDLGDVGGVVDGVRIDGKKGDVAGAVVSGAGDINGDGFSDLLLGASGGGETGKAYLLYGSATGIGTAGSLNLNALGADDGFQVLGIVPNDQFGSSRLRSAGRPTLRPDDSGLARAFQVRGHRPAAKWYRHRTLHDHPGA